MDPNVFADLVVKTIKQALAPVQADVRTLQGQIAVWEARWNDIGALRERMAVVETKALPTAGPEGPRGPEGPEGQPGRDGRDGLPGVPGAPGEKGLDGLRGIDGVNGRDGTLDQLKATFDGERTVTLCFKDGTPIDGGVITFPVPIYRGVYQDGKAYSQGDSVTWAGSTWYAKEATTTKPGDVIGAAHWILCVKKGRDGRDGKDAEQPAPVVKVGAR